ncbi:MAG: carboxypeptidase-like regulatory domain-containing protein [Planctomycetota bacterium]
MTQARIPAVLGVVVVLAMAISAILVRGEFSASETAPSLGAVSATASARSTQSWSLEPHFRGDAERRAAAATQASQPIVGVGADLGAAQRDLRPIVARGRVTWAGGTLLGEVDVALYDADGNHLDLATAAQDGTFELRHDEPLARGWSVSADAVMRSDDGSLVALAPDSMGDLPPRSPGDPPVEIALVLGFPPIITGHVFDRVTGAAIESAEIDVGSTQPAWSLETCSALSQEDGSYRLELAGMPLRGLTVWCRVDGWQTQLLGPRDVAFARGPGECLRVDFVLDRPATWRGRVASALDGSPVPGATLTAGHDLDAFSGSSNSGISDEDGRFELQLPEVPIEGVWIHAAAEGFAPVALRGVKPDQDLWIVLDPPIRLAGTVTARGSGRPCEGATVQIAFDGENESCDNGLCDEVITDASGSFEIELESAPGEAARIRVEAPGFVSFEAKLSEIVESAETGKRVASVVLTESP